MRKTYSHQRVDPDRDTMRKEYDFSGAVRGVAATRYAQGANVVVIDPEVLDVFPDALAVNEALCALAPVLRRQRDSRKQRKTRLSGSTGSPINPAPGDPSVSRKNLKG